MLLTAAAQKNIPRGIRKAYVPCWDDECEDLFCSYAEAQNTGNRDNAEDKLFSRLNVGNTGKDAETMESIQFTL